MKPIDTQGRGVKGAGQSQLAECPKTTSPTDGFQKAQGWLWGHRENIVLSAQATALFLFPVQRTSSTPDLHRGTDPVSSCCAFLAKIASRISCGVFPGCSASKRSLVYRPHIVEAVKSEISKIQSPYIYLLDSNSLGYSLSCLQDFLSKIKEFLTFPNECQLFMYSPHPLFMLLLWKG